IAAVHAFEEVDGVSFLVSEYVSGGDLRDRLRGRGPYAPRDVVELGIMVAEALAAAHRAGIVHRDLKPENIMLPEDGGVKLVDFGLARLDPDNQDTRAGLTEAGTLVGTPAYMSPEQLEGGCIDQRSDVFSLGIVLYEAATGANPFAGHTAATTMINVLHLEPPPLASRRPLAFGPLEAIVRRCLKKAPEGRYGSVAALLEDLKAARDHWGDAMGSSPAWRPDGSTAFWWWQFHQVAVTVANGLLLIPIWLVRELLAPGPVRNVLLFGYLTLLVVSAVLRTSAAFLAGQHWAVFQGSTAKRRVAVIVVDTLLSLFAVAGAGLVMSPKPSLSALLLGVSISLLLTMFVVEPVTYKAAFGGAVRGAVGSGAGSL
ncbi:MAG: serine/threonine protein kinase, partial [Acidobacteriota bacterium]|nr:serine/threonine protein kinase [Acidobacteriota bacterium]